MIIKLFIGLILGFIIGVAAMTLGYDLVAADDKNITIQTITNIIIALATILAVTINLLSIKSQKDSRRWEVNKGILLKLSTTLSDLIEQTSKFVDNEFCNAQDIPEAHKFTPDSSIYKRFDRYLAYTKDIYGVVLSDQLIKAIDEYRAEDVKITEGVEQDALQLFEAYDASLVAQGKLQRVLSQHIKKYANI